MNLLNTLDYSVLQQCMHCGMCLPTCPTYVETKKERHSPRGRISLLRSIADGELSVTGALADEMYYCLGCLACQTACPAGVKYAELFETARAEVERAEVIHSTERKFWRWLTLQVIFMHPRLLRFLGWGMRLWQRSGLDLLLRRFAFFGLLSAKWRRLERQAPRISQQFSDALIAPVESPPDKSAIRYRVGLLTGCVQDLAFSDINRDTLEVLLENGCEVVTPRAQSCCGSLHAHNGELDLARELARRQIDAFDLSSLDAIITNAGGCGSHLKQYRHLLDHDPLYCERAKEWDRKLKDVHEWLVSIRARTPQAGLDLEKVTYHESCHLCHGQRVSAQPRKLLQFLPGVEFVELQESQWCCGSAGIYNITQPEQSAKLLQRKLAHIEASGATCVTTGNPGCHLQLQNGLAGQGVKVAHPISLLAQAYRREKQLGVVA